MAKHAVLSPSGASRWLNCTPSARLEQEFPDRKSQAASEGTLAHQLGELLIREKLGLLSKIEYQRAYKDIAANELFDNAMLEHADDYATFVMERYAEAQTHTKDARLFLEQQLDLTEFVPEGFGTGDSIIVADHVLDITDLKYGKGVPVFAEKNKQMMLYALGALFLFEHLYDIHTVRMTIYQPRLDTISTWEISVNELKQWAEDELKPKAALAFEGKGEFLPGAHCGFCKAKAVCRAHADMNLEMAQHEFKNPELLTDAEIAKIMDRASMFKNWIGAVEEHALHQAVHNGKRWPGYKLVEGRSNRKYADEAQVASKLLNSGIAEDIIYTKKLIGITALQSEVGKKAFDELTKGLIIKPAGKPTLVPDTDKRPEYNSVASAQADFETIEQ